MYQPIFLYIGIKIFFSIRNRFHFLISIISVLLITFSMMSLIIMLSISNGFKKELENGIIRLIPQSILTNKNWKIKKKCLNHINISSIRDICYVSPFTTSDILIQSKNNICSGTMLGINKKDPELLLKYVLNKKSLNLSPGKYQIVLGNELAEKLSVQENDLVRLIVPGISRLTPIGEILRERIFVISGIFFSNSEVDSYQVLVNQNDASKLMNYSDEYVTGFRFWFKHPIKITKEKKYKVYKNSLILHNWTEKKGELLQSIYMEENMIKLLLVLIIVLSIFSVVSLINFMIIERRFEIAILKTYGLSEKNIVFIFLLQGLLYCFFGIIFGIGLGIFFSKNISFILSIILKKNIFLPTFIKLKQILLISVITITIAVLFTVYSALRSSVYDPCKILFYE